MRLLRPESQLTDLRWLVIEVFSRIFKLLDGVKLIFIRNLALRALFIGNLGHHTREITFLSFWV